MLTKRDHPALHVQLLDLWLIQLSNWRWSWRRMLLSGMLAPIFNIAALSIFARDSGPVALGYVLTGNIVLSLLFENLNKVSSNFAFMRSAGSLDYFATLPIRRYMLVVATVAAFLLLSLPALLVTIIFGTLWLGIQLHPSPLLLIVVPLAALPLAGLGALIGASARAPEEAGSISLFLTLVMIVLGPVIVPIDRLPPIMLLLGYLSPATYAASAFRQVLLGPLTGRLFVDLGVLTLLIVATLWLAASRMDWRQR